MDNDGNFMTKDGNFIVYCPIMNVMEHAMMGSSWSMMITPWNMIEIHGPSSLDMIGTS